MTENTLRLIDCNGYTPDQRADALETVDAALATIERTLALLRTEVERLAGAGAR